MLNHIWFGMIILAILIAGGIDFYNEVLAPVPAGSGDRTTVEKRNLNDDSNLRIGSGGNGQKGKNG